MFQGVRYAAMRNPRHLAIVVCVALPFASSNQAQRGAEAHNMVLVGHNDLNGLGDGGEGLALQQWPD